MSRKKFYTFAELSNYLSKLERNKEVRPDYKFYTRLWDEFGAWMANNVDVDTAVKFMKYHKHNEGFGTEKIYPKKMRDINPFLGMKDE